MKKVLVVLLIAVAISACVKNKNGMAVQQAAPGNSFEVTEVVQGNTYTYLKVKQNMKEKWVAVSKQDVASGDVYYFDQELQMTNFHSKEIDRTFDEIYFINNISKTPIESGVPEAMGAMGAVGGQQGHSGKVAAEQNSSVQLEKKSGEITIADVFAKRADFSAKEIEIRGIVVKVNKEVMGKNWIHIQDGTNDNGSFDLTVTSADLPEVNDEVSVKGKITLNKDFGYGYSYEVIMEDATVNTIKKAGTVM